VPDEVSSSTSTAGLVSAGSSPLFEVHDREFKPLPAFNFSSLPGALWSPVIKEEYDFGLPGLDGAWPDTAYREMKAEGFHYLDSIDGITLDSSPSLF